ncbi:DUF4197 family protein [Pedobacter sp. HMF7647]|uniref:DUF4197 family protein n=1 Tax=Hufsiella arboris TaxID=2695275 RepID=A0A7K1Y4R6_9SPHI|nr:DUF4197 domain-containing protein [Hufsiella arboris]MXV49575.1 DUF4197 family protein [Hufsiella arboris]
MKRSITLATLTGAFLIFSSCDTLNQASQVLAQTTANPTTAEIASGLKQALEVGTTESSEKLSATDGFFGNMAIKILFPPEAQKIEKTLRSVGLNQLCDNVILSVNRAAEDAAKEAKPIFIDAIKQMTITDASNILLSGQQDAATQYFKRVTSSQLQAKFNPIIEASLSKTGATKYWSTAVTSYNKIPLTSKINPDLDAYVTQKAIDGLFHEIAGEELKIRTNFSARSTGLLQKVFGFADKNKGKI